MVRTNISTREALSLLSQSPPYPQGRIGEHPQTSIEAQIILSAHDTSSSWHIVHMSPDFWNQHLYYSELPHRSTEKMLRWQPVIYEKNVTSSLPCANPCPKLFKMMVKCSGKPQHNESVDVCGCKVWTVQGANNNPTTFSVKPRLSHLWQSLQISYGIHSSPQNPHNSGGNSSLSQEITLDYGWMGKLSGDATIQIMYLLHWKILALYFYFLLFEIKLHCNNVMLKPKAVLHFTLDFLLGV